MPRRPTPAIRFALLALLVPGCAQRAQVASTTAAAQQESVNAKSVGPARTPRGLYDLVFSLRTEGAEGAAWSSLPTELHAFPLGAWECALSALEYDDRFDAEGARIDRTRRLACTHKSGATVQSELRCRASLPLAPQEASEARRELTLTLSSAPTLRLACEAEAVDRLGIIRSAGAEAESLCLVEGQPRACDGAPRSAAPQASARE